jgi:Peptidase inhibitor I78 family
MRAVAVATMLTAMLGGCKTMPDEVPTREDQRFTCNAAAVQGMVGQTATQTLGAEAVRTSGARTMRWIRPGEAVTMDYRTDRLNVHLDAQNRITQVSCG